MNLPYATLIRALSTFALLLVFGIISKAQFSSISVSGRVWDKLEKSAIPFANVILKKSSDSLFAAGTLSNETGLFTLANIKPGSYFIEVSSSGYRPQKQSVFVGRLSEFLLLGNIELEAQNKTLGEVEITAQQTGMNGKMDRRTYSVEDNISQTGGSVLQAMQNLPGITVQEGKIQLRGNDKVTVLIDGKQTALTGFGSQSGLDNLPASAIEKIEIIHNPSARYEANGNAGIVNVVMKKSSQEGWNGKLGFASGLGAFWIRKDNLPGIRPQYQLTPKINPSVSLNYRKGKTNLYLQADHLFTQTLNKNEFVTRRYSDGTTIFQQTKRNRNTNFLTTKIGLDLLLNPQNTLTFSGMFGSERIIDRGDEPFFLSDLNHRYRLWQFLEDELKTTAMATASWQHKFTEPGHFFNMGLNYNYHRENEKYFFDNIQPKLIGKDAFKLLSDEHVGDLNFDYTRPLKYGRFESGLKFRYRLIPTNMQFVPGINSALDSTAGGWANYSETIPAVYGNYVFENRKLEAELGLRMEYVNLWYDVNPGHNTYKSNGYSYAQPFPNLRFAWKINEDHKISIFYNRRVDRPNEVDIRVFPKYDDAEIIKVGNPALRPQFTNAFELAYKRSLQNGNIYASAYHRISDGTITRISSTVPESQLIYSIFQNIKRSYQTGLELIVSQTMAKNFTLDLAVNAYRNQIDAFSVMNLYPVAHVFSAEMEKIYSGNAKLNGRLKLKNQLEIMISGIYLAPDIIAQGKISGRFSLDFGLKKTVLNGKGEWVLNGSNVLNTMLVRKEINGNGVTYTSSDYNETQSLRLGYSMKF